MEEKLEIRPSLIIRVTEFQKHGGKVFKKIL